VSKTYINDYKALYRRQLIKTGGAKEEYIVFSIEGKERLKIGPEGFYVNGVLIKDSEKVYRTFVDWLMAQGVYKPPPKMKIKIRTKKKEKPGEEV